MLPVLGKPLLGWMLDRLSLARTIDDVIIATTTESHDDKIADLAGQMGYKSYRGSERDVLDRYYRTACEAKANVIVRLTADCPLIDSTVIDKVIKEYSKGECDFVSNTEPPPSTWPDGMDVSVFSFHALKTAWKQAKKPSEREHVTFHFWNNPHNFRCKRIDYSTDTSKYRLTLDYAEDLKVIEAIIEHFGKDDLSAAKRVSMEEIINYLDNHKEIFNLNKEFYPGIGWKTALELDKKLGL